MPAAEQVRNILENRSAVLRYLDESPATKPEIVDALQIPRSTLDRAIDELSEIGCVISENSAYRSTTAGHLALSEYDRYQSSTQSIQQSTTFLNFLPEDSDIDPALIDGASITLSEPHAPEQALIPSTELFREATMMKGLAPVVLSSYPELIGEQLATGDLSVEIIAAEKVISTLPKLVNSQAESILEAESLTVFETEVDLPYALWLMETPTGVHTGITAYDSTGVAGVLINNSEAAIQWAQSQYQRYREKAHLVSAIDSHNSNR